MPQDQIFISYSGEDAFEVDLLQYAVENMLRAEGAKVWTYERDQRRSEREVAAALKQRIRESKAMIFLISPFTLNDGAAQFMELAYADAFGVETFILLHHVTFDTLKSSEKGVPPLLLAGQGNPALRWRTVVDDLRKLLHSEEPR